MDSRDDQRAMPPDQPVQRAADHTHFLLEYHQVIGTDVAQAPPGVAGRNQARAASAAATLKNLILSRADSRAVPSTMFAGIENAARRTCDPSS